MLFEAPRHPPLQRETAQLVQPVHYGSSHIVYVNDFICETGIDDGLGHAVHHTGGVTLGDGTPPLLLENLHAFHAVTPHTGENDAKGPPPQRLPDRLHQHVGRWLVEGLGRVGGHHHLHVAHALFDSQVFAAGCDVGRAGLELLTRFSLLDGDGAHSVKSFGERPGEGGWHVLRNEDARREIGGQL